MHFACFAVGMIAVFSMLGGASSMPDWHLLAALPAGLLLAHVSRFAQRYTGPDWLIAYFASCGVVAMLMPAILRHIVTDTQQPLPAMILGTLHIALLALFCAVTLHALPLRDGRSAA